MKNWWRFFHRPVISRWGMLPTGRHARLKVTALFAVGDDQSGTVETF
jgi:hypothetical protein